MVVVRLAFYFRRVLYLYRTIGVSGTALTVRTVWMLSADRFTEYFGGPCCSSVTGIPGSGV